MLLFILTGIFLAISLAVVLYFKWCYGYWTRKGLPQLEPTLFWGHQNVPFYRREGNGVHFKRLYDEFRRRGWRHCGLYFFTKPAFWTADLDMLKNILIKDFEYFVDRGAFHNEESDPLSAHLFAIGGAKWRKLRTTMTPTFSTGKMKMMFQTILDCKPSLEIAVDKCFQTHQPLQVKKTLSSFSMDVIGACAFGLDCKVTTNIDESPFRKHGTKFVLSSSYRTFQQLVGECYPNFARAIGYRMLPEEVSNFYNDVIKGTLDLRKHDSSRKDFVQMLIDLKDKEGKITMEELAAQCFVFFIAGFETSSSLLTFTLYELAKHKEIQDKVRQEMREVLAAHQNQLTYEAVNDMKYLHQVLEEGARKNPPVPLMFRECVKDYKVPGEDLVIEKGTKILIPICGYQHDERFYPNPEKFDPDRFSPEQKASRHSLSFMAYGEGPRHCIGIRFGLMQNKVALIVLLTRYKFTVNSKTLEPLQIDKHAFVNTAVGDVWLNLEKLQQ